MAEESQGKPLHPDIVMRGDLPPEVERDGIILPWMVSERALQAMIDYDVRDDDVWITTYPKAGTKIYCYALCIFVLLVINIINRQMFLFHPW